VARRKAEEEDQEVDIDGFDDDQGIAAAGTARDDVEDEETRWADLEPDEDLKGWRMKTWIEDDEDPEAY
jgi:COMPASS component SWD1